MRLAVRCVAVAVVCAVAGCGGTEPRGPAGITLNRTVLSFTAIGQTQQLTGTVTDQDGRTITDATLTWTTSNAGVASVNGSGLVRSTGQGTAQITAASGGVSDEQ